MKFFLLDAAAAAPQGGVFGGSLGTVIMMVVLVVIFWLFFIRPQSKRQKELQRKRDAMTTGDKVITAGGIHGKIHAVHEREFVIEIDKDVRIRVDKSSVYAAGEDVSKQQ